MTPMRPTELEALAAMDIYPQPAREAVLKLVARHKRLVDAAGLALDELHRSHPFSFLAMIDGRAECRNEPCQQLRAALQAEETP